MLAGSWSAAGGPAAWLAGWWPDARWPLLGAIWPDLCPLRGCVRRSWQDLRSDRGMESLPAPSPIPSLLDGFCGSPSLRILLRYNVFSPAAAAYGQRRMALRGRALEDVAWLLCDGGTLRKEREADGWSALRDLDGTRGGYSATVVARRLALDGVAVVDDFLPRGRLATAERAARALDARRPSETAFLDAVAAGLLEGELPEGHPRRGRLPGAFYGPPGPAAPGQAASCLRKPEAGEVRRSWLPSADDELAPPLAPLLEASRPRWGLRARPSSLRSRIAHRGSHWIRLCWVGVTARLST